MSARPKPIGWHPSWAPSKAERDAARETATAVLAHLGECARMVLRLGHGPEREAWYRVLLDLRRIHRHLVARGGGA